MKNRIQLLVICLSFMIANIAQTVKNPQYSMMLQGLLEHNVEEISVNEIDLTDTNIIYLDARELDEYKVSHIEGAKFVGYDKFNPKTVKNLDKDANIVVYCSVGYRSEKVVQQLKRKGFTNITNLYGGLFEWTNNKMPLVDENNSNTTNIHPYDKEWGKWLKEGNKVYK